MEFRIFQSIFCQTYKIQKSAFAFNEYVEKVFEKFILVIIKIRRSDWLMVCVLVLLNWARNKLDLDYRKCPTQDQQCEDENARVMFSIAGAIIFGLTALLAVESRRLEVRIMAQKNIRSIHTYPSYLQVTTACAHCCHSFCILTVFPHHFLAQYMEESKEAKEMDSFRLNKDELKVWVITWTSSIVCPLVVSYLTSLHFPVVESSRGSKVFSHARRRRRRR